MTLRLKLVVGYLSLVSTMFVTGYVLGDIRGFPLYFYLIVINFPCSLIMVDKIAAISIAFGLSLGRYPHVWVTQIACMAANGFLLLGVVTLYKRSRSAKTRSSGP